MRAPCDLAYCQGCEDRYPLHEVFWCVQCGRCLPCCIGDGCETDPSWQEVVKAGGKPAFE